MNPWRLVLPGLFFASTVQSLRADMIPTGQRRVEAYFRLANVNQYPNYVFLAYAQGRFGDSYSILDQKRVGLTKQSQTTIFAIPKDDFNAADIQVDTVKSPNGYSQKYGHYFTAHPKLIRAAINIYPHDFIAESDSAVSVEDVWTIKTLTPDTLILASDTEVYTYASGRLDVRRNEVVTHWSWLVPGVFAVAVLAVVLYFRKRKQ
ncbi:hypothetical protein [Spirosoma aerolatum]|uniref:hypothetical protein n=1 Tax=Spirosoma aerolatum TaxID=1211326 RepID=UPI0012D2FBBB|nr:hypothetical protein [Spirosoma aerolatum]